MRCVRAILAALVALAALFSSVLIGGAATGAERPAGVASIVANEGTQIRAASRKPAKKQKPAKTKKVKWDPSIYLPMLDAVSKDGPGLSKNKCHAGPLVTVATPCTFGPEGKPRVLLFGDSHAAHWFGPLNRVRKSLGRFQLLSLTKAACAAVDYTHSIVPSGPPIPGEVVPVDKTANCKLWRQDALQKIANQEFGKLDLVILSPIVPNESSAKSRFKGWKAGYLRTMNVVAKHAKRVMVLRDMPLLKNSKYVTKCIKKRKSKAAEKCGDRPNKALNPTAWKITRQVAKKFSNVKVVDLASATCSKTWCSALKGRYIKVRDAHHYVNTYMSRFLYAPLRKQIQLIRV